MQVHYFQPPPQPLYSHMYAPMPGPYAIPPATCLGPAPTPGPVYYHPVYFPQQYSSPYYGPNMQCQRPPVTPPSPVSGIAFQFQTLNLSANFDDRYYPTLNEEYLRKLHLWLKTHRMHKYYERLTKYSFEQLLNLDVDTLANEQFTQGAIKKLLNMIERVKMDRMAFENPSRSSGSPSSSGTCSEDEPGLHGTPQRLRGAMTRQIQHSSSKGVMLAAQTPPTSYPPNPLPHGYS